MTPKKPVLRRICDQRPGGAPAVQNEFYYLYYSGGISWKKDFSFLRLSLQSLATMFDDAHSLSHEVLKQNPPMYGYQKKSVRISPFLQEAPIIRVEAGFNSRTYKADRPASPPVSPTAATLPCMCFLIDASLSLYCSIILQPFVPVPRARIHTSINSTTGWMWFTFSLEKYHMSDTFIQGSVACQISSTTTFYSVLRKRIHTLDRRSTRHEHEYTTHPAMGVHIPANWVPEAGQ
jgi:hypothetical protein